MDALGDIVKSSLGPRPNVCQEQVLLDMERAMMAKEDNRAAVIRTEKKENVWRSKKNRHLCTVVRSEILWNMCYHRLVR